MSESDRRKYPRVGRKFGVKYRVLGGAAAPEAAPHVGMITNLSQGGVELVAKRPIPVGSQLEMEFPESIFGGSRTLRGRVVSSRAGEGEDTVVGLKFERAGQPARTGRDRRRHARGEQKLALKVRCVTPGPWEEGSARSAMLQDVSKGGVEVVASREYVRNLVLELQFPESPLGPAQTFHARVVWTRGAKGGQFAHGCAFVRLVKRGG